MSQQVNCQWLKDIFFINKDKKILGRYKLLTANSVKDKAEKPFDRIFLSYENRFKRRLRMETEKGHEFLLNLPKAIELPIGGALILENGQEIEIKALKEKLFKVTPHKSQDLPKISWHIGNRHLPCQIFEDYLTIQENFVFAEMLKSLNCKIETINTTFSPMKGAYGQGRTLGHSH